MSTDFGPRGVHAPGLGAAADALGRAPGSTMGSVGATETTGTSVTTGPAGAVAAPVGSAVRRGGRRRAGLGFLGIVGFALTWELIGRTGVINAEYVPPFSTTAARLVTELGTPKLWSVLGDTLLTWAIGLGIAVSAALVVGTVIGLVPFLRRATHTTIEFLRPIPSVAIIPLAVLLLGLTREAALIVVVYAPFWQVLIQVLAGIADVDAVGRDTARSFGLGRWHRIRHLVLPTALPYVITGFRLAASIALVLTITAELVIKNPGIGRQIDVYRMAPDAPGLYALVLVTGLLGLLVNLGTRTIERRVLHWHPSVRREAAQ